MKRLVCLLVVCAAFGCKSSNQSQPFVPNNNYTPEYDNPGPNGAPEPGQGHYLSVSINGKECAGEAQDDQVKMLRAGTVSGTFTIEYSFDEQMLGRFEKAELIMYAAPGGTPDLSAYYLVTTPNNFAPNTPHELCGPDASVKFYDGSEPKVIDSLPGGKYHLELTADGENDYDQVHIAVTVVN